MDIYFGNGNSIKALDFFGKTDDVSINLLETDVQETYIKFHKIAKDKRSDKQLKIDAKKWNDDFIKSLEENNQ